MDVTHYLPIPTADGVLPLQISAGSTVLVAGPNGVGKSALLAALFRSLPQGRATYLPGHRQINFNNGWETIGQDAVQLVQNMFLHVNAFNRYKSAWAEDQFKTTVRRLLHAEAAYNRDFRLGSAPGRDISPEVGSFRLSPVDTLNLVFEGARLPVRFKLTNDGLTVVREEAEYPIDAMSDGERAALFIVSAIVTQSDNTVVLIDEPEKHLHPSITALLLDACIRAKPKVSIVVSSHDVFLIERLSPTHVIHIRNSRVTSTNPEQRIFEAEIIEDIESIPEDLRTALLGSRREVLFVEGEGGSRDLALYSHVYESVKVTPRGGHGKVQEAVGALKGLVHQHWLTPYGIIDGDGRSPEEQATLAAKNIFALPNPTIENIFFYEEMIACFVDADSAFSGGPPLEVRIATMSERCKAIAARDKFEIIALRSSWLLERRLSEAKLSPSALKDAHLAPITIDVPSIRDLAQKEVERVIDSGDWHMILQSIPIKKTGLPNEAAKALGASSFANYCSVIIRQFDIRSDIGNRTLSAIRLKLPSLTGVRACLPIRT